MGFGEFGRFGKSVVAFRRDGSVSESAFVGVVVCEDTKALVTVNCIALSSNIENLISFTCVNYPTF